MKELGWKVALFLPNLSGGGAERVTVYLAGGLLGRGYDVDLVLLEAAGPYLSDVPKGVHVVDLHAQSASKGILPLARYLRTEKPYVLLSALDYANVCALLAKRLSGAPTRTVIAIHSVHSHVAANDRSWKGRLQRILMWRCYRWADSVVAVSRGAADVAAEMNGIPKDRVHVIYNPVIGPELQNKAKEPLDHPWFEPGQPKVILAVGGLRPVKDFPLLIRAFSILRKDSAVRLMILGEGSERAKLEKLVKELNLAADVSMPGFVNNPYAYMARAAIVVLSSKWESLSTVLIEAMALQTPVVSTDCDFGPREILANGKYGKLVPPGNIEALAAGIHDVLSSNSQPVPAEALERYRFDTAVNQYIKILPG